MLSSVRVQVQFTRNVSLKLKNGIRISGFFPPVFLLRNTGFFENRRNYKKPVKKPIENPKFDMFNVIF
jgi:hypothetical protein